MMYLFNLIIMGIYLNFKMYDMNLCMDIQLQQSEFAVSGYQKATGCLGKKIPLSVMKVRQI